MRFILDTSVVTSGFRNPFGAAAELLEAALRGKFDLLVSVPLIFEYESVLMRPEHRAYAGFTPLQVDQLLFALLRAGIEVPLGPYIDPPSPDANDNHVLSLAKYGGADAIVTYNTRHFATPARLLGVDLYTAVEALRLLRS